MEEFDEKDDDYSEDYNDEFADEYAGYNSEEEKEYDIQPEPEWIPAYEAMERVTVGRVGETIIGGVGAQAKRLQQIQKRARRQDLDPEDKFFLSFNVYSAIYQKELDITDEDIKYIVDNVYRIKNIGYKNPAGMLFGYYVLDIKTKGVEINKRRLEKIFRLLPRVNIKDDIFISKPDIIRYARFWINFIKY
uniref:Uncharacterized protein n=1 Tax=Iridovirus LCIVAC01 TaxID=2506607 RepID=A0A481YS30_9VIRU|nr:MAG: uncharacterized protein LCIVAC01_00730 [Iridovirus LCIVAC01]